MKPADDLVLIAADLGCGGAQRVLSIMANAWAEDGRRISFITFSDEADDFFQLDSRINRTSISAIGSSSGSLVVAILANFKRLFRLRRAIRKSRAPAVLAFVGVTNILTVLSTIGLGLHVVISERNDPARQSLGRPWNALRRLVYPRANVVTANSRNAVDTLNEFVSPEKVVYIPNPIVMQNSAEQHLRKNVILHVGRLSRQKAQDVLLRAFARIANEVPDWRLCIVGTGALNDELRIQAEELVISTRIDWLSDIENMIALYQESSIFVLPSRFEGMPNALLEAMSCGMSVVVSDACDSAMEFVAEGESGLIVPVEDSEKLAAAMRRLIADPNLRDKLGSNAESRLSDFSVTAIFAQWDGILKLPSVADAT